MSGLNLPRRGERVVVTAHGKMMTIRKSRTGTDYVMRVNGSARVRWGNADETREDIAHFREHGALPPIAQGWA